MKVIYVVRASNNHTKPFLNTPVGHPLMTYLQDVNAKVAELYSTKQGLMPCSRNANLHVGQQFTVKHAFSL